MDGETGVSVRQLLVAMEQNLEPENVQENAKIKVSRFNTNPTTWVAAQVGYVATVADG